MCIYVCMHAVLLRLITFRTIRCRPVVSTCISARRTAMRRAKGGREWIFSREKLINWGSSLSFVAGSAVAAADTISAPWTPASSGPPPDANGSGSDTKNLDVGEISDVSRACRLQLKTAARVVARLFSLFLSFLYFFLFFLFLLSSTTFLFQLARRLVSSKRVTAFPVFAFSLSQKESGSR